jgi:hypothetical protein
MKGIAEVFLHRAIEDQPVFFAAVGFLGLSMAALAVVDAIPGGGGNGRLDRGRTIDARPTHIGCGAAIDSLPCADITPRETLEFRLGFGCAPRIDRPLHRGEAVSATRIARHAPSVRASVHRMAEGFAGLLGGERRRGIRNPPARAQRQREEEKQARRGQGQVRKSHRGKNIAMGAGRPG